MMSRRKTIVLLLLALLIPAGRTSLSQERVEPDFAEREKPLTHLDLDFRNGVGFKLQLNNFGFAVGAEYQRIISRLTTARLDFQINTLRDESEQTFQNFWGYTVIPNKYNRVLAFPVQAGLSHRIFPETLSDNFRLQVMASGGISPAFVYPYFNDLGTGFRIQGFDFPTQEHFDPFQGWGDGTFILGAAGELSIGADLGGDFGSIQSIRVGYKFQYYPGGIQVMEPNRPDRRIFDVIDFVNTRDVTRQPEGAILPAAGKQYFFGTPHITFIFGSMW